MKGMNNSIRVSRGTPRKKNRVTNANTERKRIRQTNQSPEGGDRIRQTTGKAKILRELKSKRCRKVRRSNVTELQNTNTKSEHP